MSHHDRGQLTPLLALLLALCLLLGLVIAHLGAAAVRRAQATTAADAAALAGALDGPLGAVRLARSNGAELTDFYVAGTVTEVAVTIGDVTAIAAAERLRADLAGLDPRLQGALFAAERILGEPVPVVSGRRSSAEQQALWDARHTNPYPVARPGTSAHELGLAVDVPASVAGRLAVIGPQVGLCRPLPVTDPIHFELCRRTSSR